MDFTVLTTQIRIFSGQEQQEVVFILEPDGIAQEPNETFWIVVTIDASQSQPLASNEFIQSTATVTIIDITSKEE